LFGVAATLLSVSFATAAPAANVSSIFGSRVAANARLPAPYLQGDFDGDGDADAVYLVTILPASPKAGFAKDVTVIGDQLGSAPLGNHGETLAIAIQNGTNGRKFLITGYQGDGASDYFSSPIWGAKPLPLTLAKKGSQAFRQFQKQEKRIANDVLVIGTEAGIDTALYWNGSRYVLFTPNEEP
jgi:hypothetical protein